MKTPIGIRLRRKLGSIEAVVRLYDLYRSFQSKCVRVVRQSPYENIYHCCTQKTASQWLRAIFVDPGFIKHTGLNVFPYVQLGLRYASFTEPLPPRTIGTHLYISYPTYLTIPKPLTYKTFFVLRDPRDIVVSWYFSAKFSHRLIDPIPVLRKDLQNMDLQEGMKYIIDRLDEWGSFETQRSWMNIHEDTERIKIFRYEDLARDSFTFLRDLFVYLDIVMSENEFVSLYDRHKFERHSGRRKQGTEDPYSHYRKGITGDWQNHFDRSTESYFRQRTEGLLEVLGYRE
jgi:hypothetical protein